MRVKCCVVCELSRSKVLFVWLKCCCAVCEPFWLWCVRDSWLSFSCRQTSMLLSLLPIHHFLTSATSSNPKQVICVSSFFSYHIPTACSTIYYCRCMEPVFFSSLLIRVYASATATHCVSAMLCSCCCVV